MPPRRAVAATEVHHVRPLEQAASRAEMDRLAFDPDNLRLCDEMVAIPQVGNIGSLNVSVAAGVMMYEVVRQRMSEV